MLRQLIAASILTSAAAVGMATGPLDAAPPFPDAIVLESPATAATGFRAEGIVARGHTAYAGSLATGTIVEVDLRTGEVSTLVESAGGPAVGLALDDDLLYVAGGPSGELRIYDVDDGSLIDVVALAPAGAGFINDVIVTEDGAYATDSFSATLYRIPLGGGAPEALTLTGDFQLAPGFNSNGIEDAGDGRLILAQSTDPVDGIGSALYTVVPDGPTAVADRIELDGDVTNADGLVLRGRTLYVVENQQDRVRVVTLSGDLTSGVAGETLTSPEAATPTTATLALGALYAVNARFADLGGGADPTEIDFEVIRIELH
jgi:hypothetical protein